MKSIAAVARVCDTDTFKAGQKIQSGLVDLITAFPLERFQPFAAGMAMQVEKPGHCICTLTLGNTVLSPGVAGKYFVFMLLVWVG